MNKPVTLKEISEALNLEVLCGKELLEREIQGGYVSDLLSDVMAMAKKGSIWLTLQCHPNIIAVAVLKQLAGIVIVNKKKPEQATLSKAVAKGVPVLFCHYPAFETVGKLYNMGVSG